MFLLELNHTKKVLLEPQFYEENAPKNMFLFNGDAREFLKNKIQNIL